MDKFFPGGATSRHDYLKHVNNQTAIDRVAEAIRCKTISHYRKEDEDEEPVGPQSFFRIAQLARSPREEWIFANELVPKQQRGGRSFLPRAPTAIRLVD